MKNSRIFPWIVALAAFSVSGSAAYYSVYGISKMFAGASTNVMIMAGSLEFSKLVIASLLYSYWSKLNKILRTYLTIACCILILITSAGIYGFLSAAYQETSNKVEVLDKQNGALDKQKLIVQSDAKRYESQISLKDNRINSLSDIKAKQQGTMDNLIAKNMSTHSIKSQMISIDQEITKLDNEVKVLNDSLSSKNEKLKELDLQSLSLQTNQDVAKEVGPLKYIAKLTGKSLDQVVNWFIIALMLVFDPLAVSLVIALNFLLSAKNSKRTAVAHTPDDKDIEEKSIEEDPMKGGEEIPDFLWEFEPADNRDLPFEVIDQDPEPEQDEEEELPIPIEGIKETPNNDIVIEMPLENKNISDNHTEVQYIPHTDPTNLR